MCVLGRNHLDLLDSSVCNSVNTIESFNATFCNNVSELEIVVSYGCAIAIVLQSSILNGIFTQYFLVFCKLSCFCAVHTACQGMVLVAVVQWVLKLGEGAAAQPQHPAASMGRAGCTALGAHPERRGSPAMCPKSLEKGTMCSGTSHISPENFLLH